MVSNTNAGWFEQYNLTMLKPSSMECNPTKWIGTTQKLSATPAVNLEIHAAIPPSDHQDNKNTSQHFKKKNSKYPNIES
jgi:hypothetical protein